MRSSYNHFILCSLVAWCFYCFLVLLFLFFFYFVGFPSGSSCFMLNTSVLNLRCVVSIKYMKRIVIHTQCSIFFCVCLISISLCEFGSLNPPLFSHCCLSLSLCMLNIHYYLAIATLFLSFKLILPCF